MKITYFALQAMRVGDEIREPGDLVPEASQWKNVRMYLSSGKLHPVLVATLPRDVQTELEIWEEALVEEELAMIDEMKRQDLELEVDEEEMPRPNINDPVAKWREWASQYFLDVQSMTKADLMKLDPDQEGVQDDG